MKITLLLLGYVFITVAGSSIDEQWSSYKAEYKKKYSKEEESLRLKIFTQNMKKIEEHNKRYAKGEVSYSLWMNYFSDLTPDEFSSKFTGLKTSTRTGHNPTQTFTYSSNANLPDAIDWRDKGAVTEVKQQSTCQGCWSFSVTGTMEGQLFLSTGNLVPLSEQQMIDCSKSYGNRGCQGGMFKNTFEYIKGAGGLMSEDSYPFIGMDHKCLFSPNSTVNGTKLASFVQLPAEDEEALKTAIATVGPVSVAVAAESIDFMHYKEGILTSQGCGDSIDHAVLVVGYGTEKNADYWIIKNSWGISWGEKGYMKLARNRQNTCGVASMPYYPVLDNAGTDTDKTTPKPSDAPTTPDRPITAKPNSSKACKTVYSSAQLVLASLFFLVFYLI